MTYDSFDVVVVGGGTAGMTAALAARHAGATVALVEREPRLGGDCTFYGCVPSKALIEAAQLAEELRRAAAEGIVPAVPPLDFRAVAARQARVVEELERDERDEGLEDVPYLTNRTIFSLEERPGRLLVLGGGAIGLELAQAFRRFGSEVTVVELLDRLLPNDEPEAGELIARVLGEEGIDLHLGTRVEAVRRDGAEIVLRLSGGEARGDALLVAAGRVGHTGGLGLDRIGVTVERGYVQTDARCRTSVGHVFAAGDVTGGLQFTHVASHEGRVAGSNAAGRRARVDERVTPWVTFTDPEVAHVGLTEAQARERHEGVEVVVFPMSAVDRARILGRPVGFVKLVTARRRLLGRLGGGELVGAQIVGPRAGELVHECVLAMRTRAFAGRLTQAIHAYPTMSLALQQAEAQFFPLGRALVERRDLT